MRVLSKLWNTGKKQHRSRIPPLHFKGRGSRLHKNRSTELKSGGITGEKENDSLGTQGGAGKVRPSSRDPAASVQKDL